MYYIFRVSSLFLGCNDIATRSVSHILLESHYCNTAVGPTCETVVYQDNW
jgi:hypothetical protein